jgi:hypothetical protein
MSKPRHRGCRGLQMRVKQHDPRSCSSAKKCGHFRRKLHANAIGCAGLIYLLATSYQPSVNGFYIEFLAITAEVFRPPSTASGHCSRSHGPPSSLSLSQSNWCMFNRSASTPCVTLTEEPTFPLHHHSLAIILAMCPGEGS